MNKENFDFFEQQAIMNGETSPQDIIAERHKKDCKLYCHWAFSKIIHYSKIIHSLFD